MAEKSEKINFEESLKKLETIVKEMESGSLSLDDMLKRFNEGRDLVKSCNEQLEAVRQSLERVVLNDANQIVGTVPLDIKKT